VAGGNTQVIVISRRSYLHAACSTKQKPESSGNDQNGLMAMLSDEEYDVALA
jgi:hypothetical protein